MRFIAAASAVCLAGAAAAAQTAAPAPREGTQVAAPREAAQPAAARGAEEADVAITARVTAGELLFRKVPNPRVDFTGRPARETVWEAERQNLPAEVQPGVTYRDVGITLRITSIFPDIDRIVAEALGEVPTTDDAEPRPTAAPAAPPVASGPAPATRAPGRPRRGRGQ